MSANRLVHSSSAFLRSMQMSRASLFALVEGKNLDPFFYGQICKSVCEPRGMFYEVRKASELPQSAGGKIALVEFFKHLRQKHLLVSFLGGKKTTVVFFLDKDIDDLSRTRRRSKHVIYTRYYDVHNEVFRHGDLVLGAACAASIDKELLRSLLVDSTGWCLQASRRWRDWLVLCLISARMKVSGQHNFRVSSPIQNPKTGNLDLSLLEQAKSTMATKLGLDTTDFQLIYNRHNAIVGHYFRSGQHDIIFKGKWYPLLLDEDIRHLMGQVEFMKDGFTKRITATVAATLKFTDSWTDYYTSRLQAAIG